MRFGIVGCSGVAVNLVVLHVMLTAGVLGDAADATVAAQVAIWWNFTLVEVWVFRARTDGSRLARAAAWWALNTASLVVQLPLAAVLDRVTPIDYLRCTFLALLVLVLLRYGVCNRWLYRRSGSTNRAQTGLPTTVAEDAIVIDLTEPKSRQAAGTV